MVAEAVMVALPSETPVTTPSFTVAMEFAEETQETVLESDAVAVRVTVSPTATEAVVFEMVTLPEGVVEKSLMTSLAGVATPVEVVL